ncbi:MAG TPA: phosphatase PAP2 family protein [Ignavibacteriaceae bacterium]|nr:phosphatase PAP2 family protein [Ignavibacteriaceae bacterium]
MKKNWLVAVLVSVWIIFAIIFGINDLEISKQIVNQNSSWAKFLQDYGMIPGIFVLLSGVYLYYSLIKIKSDAWSYIQKVVFFLVSSGLIFHLSEIIIGNFVTNNLIIFFVISFAISLIVIIALHFKSQVQNILAVRYAKVVVGVALFGYVILIQGIKYFWGRVRFRELDATFSQFTPWYLPQGITGFDSFPSGHAAMGWMLLPLLIFLSTKKEWIKNLSFVLIFIWGVILASSRVVIGAHYASDVLFGSFFIIISFLLFNKYYSKSDLTDR